MKRILFVQPPFFRFLDIHARYFPYQFVSMGTYLKANGHQVKILEGDKYEKYGQLDFSDQESLYDNYLCHLTNYSDPFWKTLEEVIQSYKPDYIGITVWTTFIASAIRTAQFCKKVSPSSVMIAGGPHVTLLPKDIQKSDVFDIGVIGEGEQTMLEIVNGRPLSAIQGIFYTDNGKIRENDPRQFEKDLDKFGIPDRSLLINEGRYEPEDMGLVMTSRGCPFSCAYCATSIWKNKVRLRSIPSIIAEIKSVHQDYGTIYFTIKDDSFLINRPRILEFCKQLKREKLGIFWECNANLVNIDRDLLLEMKSAGCIAVKVGIETGSDHMHQIINKKLTNQKVETLIEHFSKTGIHLTCYFMMGIPGETKEDMLKTLAFAKKIKPDFVSFSVYEIFPETVLHKKGIENKTALETMTLDDYFNVKPHNYFYVNQKRHLPGMTYEEFDHMERYMKNEFKKYNRTPRSIFKRIKSRSPLYKRDAHYFFHDIKSFFSWV